MKIKIKTKTKTAPPPGFTSTNSNNNFEQKTISELVNVLRGTCQFDTYDTIEGILVNRYTTLRTEIQQELQQKFELEKLQLQEKLQMEERLRIQAEEEVKRKDKVCEKGKRVQESYDKLLKEVKDGLAYRDIKDLKKKNGKLECEVKNLKEKCVYDSNKFDVMRTKNKELESEVLEFRKMKGEWERDSNELGVLRKMVGELEKKNLELKKLEELEGDKNALVAGLKIQIGELEERVKNHLTTISELGEENCKLDHEKRKFEILYKSLLTKYREQQERVSKLKKVTELLMNVDASSDGNNEPHADPMVADFGDLTVDNVFGHDTVETAPLRRNEDVHDSFGVAASTLPQNIGGNNAQGASSASGTVKLGGKDSEIIIVDDDDDRSISQRVHGKKTIFGHAVTDEYPSSSVATQQKSKCANAVVDTAKREFSFPNIDTSNDDSSVDSFFDNLPISTVLSKGKKRKI